jgi:hypothetical protein
MCQGSDVIQLQNTIAELRAQIRDLELEIAMSQPRQPTQAEPPVKQKMTRTQARLLADKLGVSKRTIWRRLDAGKLTADDIQES